MKINRSDHSAFLALIASLILHGTVFYALSHAAITDFAHQRYQKPPLLSALTNKKIDTPLVVENPTTPLAPPPKIPAAPLPPTPAQRTNVDIPLPPEPPLAKSKPIIPTELAPASDPPPLVRTDGFGELSGTPEATALHSLSGDKPMQAHKAQQDQPYISRDPSGQRQPQEKTAETAASPLQPLKNKIPSAPEKTILAAETSSPREAAKSNPAPLAATPTPSPSPSPSAKAITPNPSSTVIGPSPTAPRPALAMAVPTTPSPTGPKAQEPADKKAEDPTSGKAGTAHAEAASPASGDPAPPSDADSDPFSIVGSVEFRPGKVLAHFGRKVKTVRPKLSLAGQYDLLTLASPAVVLRVRTDATGAVREVIIIKSSGSNEVDLPSKLAMYEWWFEPPRDKDGKPQPSEMIWTINWHVR